MLEALAPDSQLVEAIGCWKDCREGWSSTSVPMRMAHDLLLAEHRYLDVVYCNIWFDSIRQEGVSSPSHGEVSRGFAFFDLIFRTLRNLVLDMLWEL
ncbi:hypothetical protein Sjap_008048 [Stephania japonica]|uniref:Uncharacterized protein n=1 Tax=Stephania japonica TaxID=461633 RepID=A0AAP0PBX5_9MAGN